LKIVVIPLERFDVPCQDPQKRAVAGIVS